MTGKRNTSRPSLKLTARQPLLTMSKPPDIIYINTKWDHFDILASSKSDYHCKIKENLFIQELYKPAFYVNVICQKADALLTRRLLYWHNA